MDALLENIQLLESRFDQFETAVQAFLPEPGRFDRLRREAAQLLARFPEPAARPVLFGRLAGVKDIFRVDGFETRAGSKLPPELFGGAEAECVSQLEARVAW